MVFSSPAVVDGVVYIGSEDGKLYALDAGCWRREHWPRNRRHDRRIVNGGRRHGLYRGYDNHLYAIDRTGGSNAGTSKRAPVVCLASRGRWDGLYQARSMDRSMRSTPPAAVALVGDWRFGDLLDRRGRQRHRLLRHDRWRAAGGGCRQRRHHLGAASRRVCEFLVAVANGIVYAGGSVGLHAFDAASGAPIWIYPIDQGVYHRRPWWTRPSMPGLTAGRWWRSMPGPARWHGRGRCG